jgi:hypothetical protein
MRRLTLLCSLLLSTACAKVPTVEVPGAAVTLAPVQSATLSALPEGFSVRDERAYPGLPMALANGQLDYAERHDLDVGPQVEALVDALSSVLSGRRDQAYEQLQLLASSEDEGVRTTAAGLLGQMLYDRGDFVALTDMLGDGTGAGPEPSPHSPTTPTSMLKTG